MKETYHPLVSIVIPVYNGSNYLREAIDSALAQTYDNIEIIVVNDGSADEGRTEAIAKSYGDRIRYVSKENGGSSSALNEGICQMRGEWFSWLSHDDLYLPEKVSKQISMINSLGLCYVPDLYRHVFFSAAELIDSSGKRIKRELLSKRESREKWINSLENNVELISSPTGGYFHGCSCLINKKAFEEAGLFDEHLRLLNDVDMWYRLYEKGYRVHYDSSVLVKGRIHSSQVSKSVGYSYHNAEQDMFWTRCFSWMNENCPNDFAAFYRYGKNAYLKTRYKDGDDAFEKAKQLEPTKCIILAFAKAVFKLTSTAVFGLKKCYYAIKT